MAYKRAFLEAGARAGGQKIDCSKMVQVARGLSKKTRSLNV